MLNGVKSPTPYYRETGRAINTGTSASWVVR
jgi:hypothetical protein